MILTPEQETWVAALEACMAGERDQLDCAALIRTQAARIEALEGVLRSCDAPMRAFVHADYSKIGQHILDNMTRNLRLALDQTRAALKAAYQPLEPPTEAEIDHLAAAAWGVFEGCDAESGLANWGANQGLGESPDNEKAFWRKIVRTAIGEFVKMRHHP